MPMTVSEVIEWLKTLSPDSLLCITDIDNGQEFSIFAIEPGATQGTVSFEIHKNDEEE